MSTTDWIPMPELVPRGIYYLRSRNLISGAWNPATRGFIGIREKFDSRYLFTEYHHDADPVVGTARPVEQVGTLAPHVVLAERVGEGDARRPNQPLLLALEQYEPGLFARQEEDFRLLEIEQKAREEARWQSGEGWRRNEGTGLWETIDGRTKTNDEFVAEIRAAVRRR